ncbi:MAG: LarC family nickel insertion protein [Pseudomonadota bacterium]
MLDPLGGIAGDMFVAAMLDAWPEHGDTTLATLRDAGLPDTIRTRIIDAEDHHIGGRRFTVDGAADGHHHRHWRQIRSELGVSALKSEVKDRAIAIFADLAAAEAAIHRTTIEEVSFHEVGAWDSIADIVATAHLIEAVGPAHWHVASLPLGSGTVRTQHGVLPVPAPATMHLLQGFNFHNDGRPGERITPTGAAILKHLTPHQGTTGPHGRLLRTGHGFGTKRFADMPNMLRVTAFDSGVLPTLERDRVGVLECEIDDQTSEDLAVALDHLRALPGVRDVLQIPAFGKKGRIVVSLRILAEPDRIDEIAAHTFDETTTLGIRVHQHERFILSREINKRDGQTVKSAKRPSGATSKLDMEGLSAIRGHAQRQQKRAKYED